MPTKFEEHVYNSYLRVSRSKQGKPFRYRKNFDDFESSNLYPPLVKLSRFFERHEHIDIDNFLEAPFDIMPDFAPILDFYITQAAIKAYTTWIKKCQDLPPDSPYHIEMCKKSLREIFEFCKNNNIHWSQYLESQEVVPHWIRLLKERKISIYFLMGYNGFKRNIDDLEADILDLFIPQIYSNYFQYKQSYINSKKCRNFVERSHKSMIIRFNDVLRK